MGRGELVLVCIGTFHFGSAICVEVDGFRCKFKKILNFVLIGTG